MRRNTFQIAPGVVVIRDAGGWGATSNPGTSRPYAVKMDGATVVLGSSCVLNGRLWRTAAGAVRTFASLDAARKAWRAWQGQGKPQAPAAGA